MLRLATIGTSWITEQFIEAVLQTGEIELGAVYSRSKDRAQELADKYEGEYSTNNLDQMLEDESINLVYIASPNNYHFDQAMAAIEAGNHVIVEKPIFTSTDQWDQAFAAAEEKGVYLFEAARHIHTKNYQHLKALVNFKRENAAYQFLGGNLNIGQYSSKYDRYNQALKSGEDLPNVFNPDFEGGSLMDIGVYPLYVVIDLFGEPTAANYQPVQGANGIDLTGHVTLEYDSFTIVIFASKAVHSNFSSELYFDNETIEINNITDIDRIELHSAKEADLLKIEYPVSNPLFDEAKKFAEIINEGDSETYEELKALSKSVNKIINQIR